MLYAKKGIVQLVSLDKCRDYIMFTTVNWLIRQQTGLLASWPAGKLGT